MLIIFRGRLVYKSGEIGVARVWSQRNDKTYISKLPKTLLKTQILNLAPPP